MAAWRDSSTGGSGTLNGRRRHVGQRTRSGLRWPAGRGRRAAAGLVGAALLVSGLGACGPPPPPPWAATTRTTPAGYVATDVGCAASRDAGALEAFFSRRVGPGPRLGLPARLSARAEPMAVAVPGRLHRPHGPGDPARRRPASPTTPRSSRPGSASRCSTGDRRAARRPSSPVTARSRSTGGGGPSAASSTGTGSGSSGSRW